MSIELRLVLEHLHFCGCFVIEASQILFHHRQKLAQDLQLFWIECRQSPPFLEFHRCMDGWRLGVVMDVGASRGWQRLSLLSLVTASSFNQRAQYIKAWL